LSAAWGDYDNDGLPDLYITDQGGVRNQLYHNSGGGAFTRVASGSELTSAVNSMAARGVITTMTDTSIFS